MAVTINEGTAVDVLTVVNSGTEIQVVKLDIGGGTAISDFGGTLPVVTTVANLTNGTVRMSIGTVTTGTVQRLQDIGTLNLGTVDSVSQLPPNYFGTTVTSGTSTLGTIRAASAGSAIFVTDMIISVGTLASNVVIGMGGTSTPLIGTLSFAANGGMVSNFRVAGSVTSGSALVYQQSANIPLSITVNGFVR